MILNHICDHRIRVQHISLLLVALIMAFTVGSSIAAVAVRHTAEESLEEHSTVVINTLTWYALTVSAGLVGIMLWNVKDMKQSMRQNHEELRRELKKKMSIQLHNAICEQQVEEEVE